MKLSFRLLSPMQLVSTGVSLNFNNFRHNLFQMLYITLANMWCGVRVIQNRSIPAFSSSKFLGLYWLLRYCFIDPHTFSIGFKSGDSGGVGHQLTLFVWKKFSICWLACLGSLSWYNLCPSLKFSSINGTSPAQLQKLGPNTGYSLYQCLTYVS